METRRDRRVVRPAQLEPLDRVVALLFEIRLRECGRVLHAAIVSPLVVSSTSVTSRMMSGSGTQSATECPLACAGDRRHARRAPGVGIHERCHSLVCSFDTSECTDDHEVRDYRGRVFDFEGRPASDVALLHGSGLYGRHKEPFRTDEQGRFCVTALPGPTSTFITVDGQTHVSTEIVRSSAPVDPRFADPAVIDRLTASTREHLVDRLPFIVGEPYPGAAVQTATFHTTGAHDAGELWSEATDGTSECHVVGTTPAWYRFEDSRRSWQFVALFLAPIATFALLLVGIGLYLGTRSSGSRAATSRADRTLQLTCLLAVLTVALTYALWSFG